MSHPIFLQQTRSLAMAPRGGAIGSEVTLGMAGLQPKQSVRVAFANLMGYELIHTVVADAEGNFITTVKVPDWASPDQVHYFFVNVGGGQPRAFSEGFHVTAADGTARVDGTIGGEADSCIELRNDADVLYNLVGEIGEWSPGDRVSVMGTIANAASCGGLGVAIEVIEITAMGG